MGVVHVQGLDDLHRRADHAAFIGVATGADAQVGDLAALARLNHARCYRRQQVVGDGGGVGEATLRPVINTRVHVAVAVDDAAVGGRADHEDVGVAGLEVGQHQALDLVDGLVTVVVHRIVEDLQAVRVGVGFRVHGHVGELGRGVVIHRHNAHGFVVGDDVAFHDHVVRCHYHDAGAGGDAAHGGTWRAEVRRVVVGDPVVADYHVVGGLDRQAGGNESQHAAGVVVDEVALNDCVAAVFDLDAGDAVEYLIKGHVHVVAHAHVDSRVFDTGDHVVLHHTVLAELREDAVHAGIHNYVIPDLIIVSRLAHDGVPLVLGNQEALDHDVVAGEQDGVV